MSGQDRLDPSQLAQFGREGYLVVPSVVASSLRERALEAIETIHRAAPPPPATRPHSFYWKMFDPGNRQDPIFSLLLDSPAYALAASMIAPRELAPPKTVQIALNVPSQAPAPHGPHLDGLEPREPDGRPWTFTLLAGIFLTDQENDDMGNVWAWPGTHLQYGDYFRQYGADALLSCPPLPPIALPQPQQIRGKAGDLLLCHYLLGHQTGRNLSTHVRKAVYFRLDSQHHRQHWRTCLEQPFHEFAPVASAICVS